MKALLFMLFILFSAGQIIAQKIIEQYTPQSNSLRIGLEKENVIPYNERGYTLTLPDSIRNIKGVLISLEDRKFSIQGDPRQQIYQQATAKGFALLYVSTGIPVDLFLSASSLAYVDSVINSVFSSHHLPNGNIFFLGADLAGHRALKYIEYYKQKKSIFHPDIKGIILCDGVLDWVRQWYEAKKGTRDHFAESSVAEGKMIIYLLEKNLGGTPKNKLEKYLDFSSYSYFDEKNRHLTYYKDYPIRAYSEPATHYWMEKRRKTTFDTNFPDLVGIINEQKLAGNTRSELVLFNQDKNNMDRRNPNYTWGLVDKPELMNWIITQCSW